MNSLIKMINDPFLILEKAYNHGRLAHAYLFTGGGIEHMRAMARRVGALINCENAESSSCGKCISCRKIAEDKHPDVQFIKPAGAMRKLKIDQIRSMHDIAHMKPYEGRNKLFVFIEADTLNAEASNALLKILEEPPVCTFFILISLHPEKLFTTILSRCQRVRFIRNDDSCFTELSLKDGSLSDIELTLLKELTGGDIETAKRWLDEGIFERKIQAHNILNKALQPGGYSSFVMADKILVELETNRKEREKLLSEEMRKLKDVEKSYLKNIESEGNAQIAGEYREEILGIWDVFAFGIRQFYLKNLNDSKCPIMELMKFVEEGRKRSISNVPFRLILESFFLKLKEAVNSPAS
ncbi:MAG: hypothetical protein P9M03_09090 [Candidatus Theseobacter exili]|nr:hypothetical protein [Candidatus Theseobacter exili]